MTKLLMTQLLAQAGTPTETWPCMPQPRPACSLNVIQQIAGYRAVSKRRKQEENPVKAKGKESKRKRSSSEAMELIEAFKLNADRVDQYPMELITGDAVLAVLTEKGDCIEKHINWKNKDAPLKSQIRNYRVTPEQCYCVSLLMSVHTAIRGSDPRCCTAPVDQIRHLCGQTPFTVQQLHGRKRQKLAHSTPIHNHAQFTTLSGMPMHRIRPTATERDLDVSTNCIINELEITAQHLGSVSDKRNQQLHPNLLPSDLLTLELPGGKTAPEPVSFGKGHAPPDFTETHNLNFLLTALFKAFVFRFTGSSETLELFPLWKKQQAEELQDDLWERDPMSSMEQNLPMNNLESLQEWCLFVSDQLSGITEKGGLGKSCGRFLSKQQEGMIPKQLRESVRLMLLLFHRMLPEFQLAEDSPRGRDGIVAKALKKMFPLKSNQSNRLEMLHVLVRTMSDAGDFQQNQKLYQIAHQITLDVETFFLDCFGETTTDSIFPGFGGREGLQLVEFKEKLAMTEEKRELWKKLEKNRNTRIAQKLRLQELHNLSTEWMRNELFERATMNVVVDTEGKLRNRLSGRLFTLSDTEHKPCCKLSIGSRQASTNRTISDAPRSHTNHTHPRANPQQWDKDLAVPFKHCVEAFIHVDEKRKSIPGHFVPDESGHVSPEELKRMLDADAENEIDTHEIEEDTLFEDDMGDMRVPDGNVDVSMQDLSILIEESSDDEDGEDDDEDNDDDDGDGSEDDSSESSEDKDDGSEDEEEEDTNNKSNNDWDNRQDEEDENEEVKYTEEFNAISWNAASAEETEKATQVEAV